MLNINCQGVIYEVLSCIFAVIFVVTLIVNGNIIDLVYMSIVFMFIIKYFIEIWRK